MNHRHISDNVVLLPADAADLGKCAYIAARFDDDGGQRIRCDQQPTNHLIVQMTEHDDGTLAAASALFCDGHLGRATEEPHLTHHDYTPACIHPDAELAVLVHDGRILKSRCIVDQPEPEQQ